ncbi:YegP family protein [Streptomyces goshikiensis]|uniref:YegP family protein n=1 Tax=Streptomyces goshikiensis TaxID=1942 RepID=UPI003617D976
MATNGQVILTSQHYEPHRSCMNGIDSVKRNSGAPIQDTTGSTEKSTRRHVARCTGLQEGKESPS